MRKSWKRTAVLPLMALICLTAPDCRAQTVQEGQVVPLPGAGLTHGACVTLAGQKECVTASNPSLVTAVATVLSARIIGDVRQYAAENGKKLNELNNRVAATNAAIVSLVAELKQQNELMRSGLRAELLARIERLPIDVVKDEQAYNMLKERLKADLETVFAKK